MIILAKDKYTNKKNTRQTFLVDANASKRSKEWQTDDKCKTIQNKLKTKARQTVFWIKDKYRMNEMHTI